MSSPSNPFDKAAREAARKTDEELAGELAKLETVTWDKVRKMLPEPMDQAKLDELIKIVKGATDHNEKVAELTRNIGRLGGTVVKVLGQLP